MLIRHLLAAFSSVLFPLTVVWATSIPNNFPSELIYNNAPIDPLCFSENINKDVTINLHQYANIKSEYKEGDVETKRNWRESFEEGIGFDRIYIFDGEEAYGGFVHYRPVGKVYQWQAILLTESGGGSGVFFTLLLVKRDGNNVHLRTLASGDRANGSVVSAEIKEDKLLYKIALTPYMLFMLEGGNFPKLKAYDQLANCAICDGGTATYIVNEDLKPRLHSVTIKRGEFGKSKYQGCLNDLIIKGTQDKQDKNLDLTPVQLKTFRKKFNAVCIKKNRLS